MAWSESTHTAAEERRQYVDGRDYISADQFKLTAFSKQLKLAPEEGAGELCGKLWSVALVLINYLETALGPECLRGKRVLELGAGVGAVGLAMACAGADVTLTDIPDCLPMLDRNIKANEGVIAECGGRAQSAELWWGEEGFKTSPLALPSVAPFHFIVGSDLIYDHDVHEYLLWSMDKFLTRDNSVYMSFIARPYDLIFCAKLCDACDPATGKKLFKMVPVDLADDLGVDDVHIIKVVSARYA